jgi:hypothetical protein
MLRRYRCGSCSGTGEHRLDARRACRNRDRCWGADPRTGDSSRCRRRQAADAEEARAHAEAVRSEAEERGLERRRNLLGWSPGGVESHAVALVTDRAELDCAAPALVAGDPTSYVVLRANEGDASVNRGRDLRMLIKGQGYPSRLPTLAEREALEKGFGVTFGVPSTGQAQHRHRR